MPLDIPLPEDSPYVDIAPYVPLLLSAVEGFLETKDVWLPEDYNDAINRMETLKQWIVENVPCTGGDTVLPTQGIVFPYQVTAGEGYTLFVGAPQDLLCPFNVFGQVVPAEVGANFSFTMLLEAGTYTVRVMGVRNEGGGITDWTIDDVEFINDYDLYSPTVEFGESGASMIVLESGNKVIKCTTVGKNESATDYNGAFVFFSAVRNE